MTHEECCICGKPATEFIRRPDGKTDWFCVPCYKAGKKIEKIEKRLK